MLLVEFRRAIWPPVITESEGECLDVMRGVKAISGVWRSLPRRSGEPDGEDDREPSGEGVRSLGMVMLAVSENGLPSSVGGEAGVGSSTIAGIPSASAFKVLFLYALFARKRRLQYLVRRSPLTRSRLTRSVTLSTFSRRANRSSSNSAFSSSMSKF